MKKNKPTLPKPDFTIKPDKCPMCGGLDFSPVSEGVLYNPNGEYVVGYGHTPVYINKTSSWKCFYCGWWNAGNQTILPRP